jgi:NADH dehydrogenase FAD-containing subunit
MAERVLVLGGGLAGVAAALRLGDEGVDVTLVDRNDYHQFQPLLYQVASSQLPAEDIARPHRTIFKDHPAVTLVTAEVAAANLSERSLVLTDGQTLTGSHVVMAAGARPNFFGVPGAAEHAFPLYSVTDAERLRQHLQQLLQKAWLPMVAPSRARSMSLVRRRQHVPARTTVWGGGESGAAIAQNAGPAPGHGGRLDVRPDLTVEGYPGGYAVGDVANIPLRSPRSATTRGLPSSTRRRSTTSRPAPVCPGPRSQRSRSPHSPAQAGRWATGGAACPRPQPHRGRRPGDVVRPVAFVAGRRRRGHCVTPAPVPSAPVPEAHR